MTRPQPPGSRGARRTRVIGVIDPHRLYTVEAVMRHAGIGSSSLAEARASGIVTPVMAAGRAYYDGAELIAWIKATGKPLRKKKEKT